MKLRELRKQRNWSMKQLGEMVGCSESSISLYETGKREPSFETLLKFGEIFDVSVDYLLGKHPEEVEKEQPATFKGDELTFDDFTYALHNEAQKLTNENKQKLLEMAKFFQQQQELAAQPDKEH